MPAVPAPPIPPYTEEQGKWADKGVLEQLWGEKDSPREALWAFKYVEFLFPVIRLAAGYKAEREQWKELAVDADESREQAEAERDKWKAEATLDVDTAGYILTLEDALRKAIKLVERVRYYDEPMNASEAITYCRTQIETLVEDVLGESTYLNAEEGAWKAQMALRELEADPSFRQYGRWYGITRRGLGESTDAPTYRLYPACQDGRHEKCHRTFGGSLCSCKCHGESTDAKK